MSSAISWLQLATPFEGSKSINKNAGKHDHKYNQETLITWWSVLFKTPYLNYVKKTIF